MAVMLKFQSSGTVPGNARPVPMQGGSLTVGRGPANDLVLPDPDRLLSKSHFVIEDHNGNVVIVDLSTNGTFLNYSKIPLGNTPTPLNNGDVLALGNYELVVEITADTPDMGDFIPPPSAQGGASHGDANRAPDPFDLLDDAGSGDFLDDLLGPEKPTGPSQINPVDPIDDLLPPMGEEEDPFFQKPSDGREGTGASISSHNPSASDSFRPQQSSSSNMIPDDWDDLLEGIGNDNGGPKDDPFAAPPEPQPMPPESEAPRRTPPVLPPEDLGDDVFAPEPQAPEEPAAPVEQPAAPVEPTPAQPVAAGQVDMARAFLEGAGAEDVRIDDAELPQTMARMGRVMKTLITGLREILMTRTSIKSEFRIEQTMISAGGNNPLKFSISPEQAVETMIKPATKGYLSPESAAEQALQDIKAHEVAMVTGMEAALKGVLKKLDPEQLAGQIEVSGAFGSLLRGKKARYWEVYEKIYAEISDQAENDFHDLFSREFARAYKEQLEKLKQ